MSLINEALKKAQRRRSGDASDVLPPMPGAGPRVAKRAQPQTSQQLVLVAAGGIALVVLSVVVTVYLVNRPPEAKPVVSTKPVAPAHAVTPLASTPLIVAPTAAPNLTAQAPIVTSALPSVAVPTFQDKPMGEPARIPVAAEPKPLVASTPVQPATSQENPVVAAQTPSPVATRLAMAPPTVVSAPAVPLAEQIPTAAGTSVAKLDERVSLFVDGIRVAGIRSSGNESRVLMNDRVFRVNDIVERTFGLRLTKVETNSLTFTDAGGAVYVKNF